MSDEYEKYLQCLEKISNLWVSLEDTITKSVSEVCSDVDSPWFQVGKVLLKESFEAFKTDAIQRLNVEVFEAARPCGK
jgi:hypothetical protein